jgi:hypothetical protein
MIARQSQREVLADDTDYIFSYHTAELEGLGVLTFIHLEVWYFSPSVLRRMKETWRLFREYVRGPLFTIGDVDDAKHRKFVSRFGFEPLMCVGCTDGQSRTLHIHKDIR